MAPTFITEYGEAPLGRRVSWLFAISETHETAGLEESEQGVPLIWGPVPGEVRPGDTSSLALRHTGDAQQLT